MRETSVITKIRELGRGGVRHELLVRGIGDDCAVLRPRPNHDLVFTCDFVLEGRHFTRDTHKAADVGHKALARSLSDLAAMGSVPVFCLVSLAVPADLGSRWVEQFYRGLLSLASASGTTLAGGDLAHFEHVIADVTCCGEVPRGKALLRSGARAGDRIYVTGQLGGSANGLARGHGPNLRRHLRPQPRIQLGLVLQRLRCSACMDVSDGLALDLHRLLLESGVSANLSGLIPIASQASLNEALYGGEDYELLFTVRDETRVPADVDGVPITEIGTITAGNAGRVLFCGKPLKPKGFDHFQ